MNGTIALMNIFKKGLDLDFFFEKGLLLFHGCIIYDLLKYGRGWVQCSGRMAGRPKGEKDMHVRRLAGRLTIMTKNFSMHAFVN